MSDDEAAGTVSGSGDADVPTYTLQCTACTFRREVTGEDRVLDIVKEHEDAGENHFVEFKLHDADD